jgi:hypothetical protein
METVDVSVMSELDLVLGFYFQEGDTTCWAIVIDVTLVGSVLIFLRIKEFVEPSSGEGG